MTNRMILLLTLVAVLIGGAFAIMPRLQERVMISRLRGNDQEAREALHWLIKRRGVAAFDIAYTHGSPYIQSWLPWYVDDLCGGGLSRGQHKMSMTSREFAELRGWKPTAEEAWAILLRGMQVSDQQARIAAVSVVYDLQATHPLLTAQNVAQLLPLLDRPNSANAVEDTHLWEILSMTEDHQMLDAIPDAFLLHALSGKYPDPAFGVLTKKYATREVRWKHGTSGTINLPNPLLLALMQSPSMNAQVEACQQLACNYDAVATHDYAAEASSDPLKGNGADIELRYAGPPLRNNRVVEKTMGISTAEVIRTLDKDLKHFPQGYACGHELWMLLTGEKR